MDKVRMALGYTGAVMAATIVAGAVLSGCQKPAAIQEDADIPYLEFPVSSPNGGSGDSSNGESGWETMGQSQITVYDADGNSMVYDVLIEARDGGDNAPVEGSIRMSRVLDAGDPSNEEETDRDEKCARWAMANVLVGITNRDSEKLQEFGVANCSAESMDSMFEAMKAVCSVSTELVFLDAKLLNGETFLVNAIAPNYTTGAIVQKIDGVWQIPYVSGMHDPEESVQMQDGSGEQDTPEE